MLDLGKDHSQGFDARVFSVSLSFLRYTLFSYHNEMQNTGFKGVLIDQLAEEVAQITYVQRLWQFFRGLFVISFSKKFLNFLK